MQGLGETNVEFTLEGKEITDGQLLGEMEGAEGVGLICCLFVVLGYLCCGFCSQTILYVVQFEGGL